MFFNVAKLLRDWFLSFYSFSFTLLWPFTESSWYNEKCEKLGREGTEKCAYGGSSISWSIKSKIQLRFQWASGTVHLLLLLYTFIISFIINNIHLLLLLRTHLCGMVTFQTHILDLPAEILFGVYEELKSKDRKNLASVHDRLNEIEKISGCRKFYRISFEPVSYFNFTPFILWFCLLQFSKIFDFRTHLIQLRYMVIHRLIWCGMNWILQPEALQNF